MNIAECSLIYICAINNPHIICSLIYFALPILLFIATFTHVLPRPPRRRRGRFIVPVPTKFHKMALHIRIVDIAMLLFLFIVPHVLPRPPRRRRVRFIVPVPTKFHKTALRIPTVDIAIHHTASTNTHKMALHIRIVGVAIHHTVST